MTTQKDWVHPLNFRQLKSIPDWKEWRKLWCTTNDYQVLLGLLHSAPNVVAETKQDMIDQYSDLLEIADGYGNSWEFASRDGVLGLGAHEAMLLGQMRQGLASKAFAILAASLFKHIPNAFEDYTPDSLLVPEIFHKLLWFFDDRDRRRVGNNAPQRHRGRTHTVSAAVCFIEAMLEFIWITPYVRGYHDERRADLSRMLYAARGQMMRIAYHAHYLECLRSQHIWRELDDADMRLMKTLVLEGGMTKYKTIKGALRTSGMTVYGADVYLVLEAQKRRNKWH